MSGHISNNLLLHCG